MSETKTKEEFLADRKAAAQRIDVETCEIMWEYIQILDPYGVEPDLPDEKLQVGRGYFVRSFESDGWVSVYDLPRGRASRVHDRIKKGLEQDRDDDIPF